MIFLSVWELVFVTFSGLFLDFLILFTLRGHNFFNSIRFSTIFNALEAPIEKVQVLFRH
jgi:hypothetical protein